MQVKRFKQEPAEADDFYDCLFVKMDPAAKVVDTISAAQRVQGEMDHYLAEPMIHPGSGDPFLWWQARREIFPVLHEMCLRYLAIPGTSVPSERVFSRAGHILNKKRAALHPDNADMLIYKL